MIRLAEPGEVHEKRDHTRIGGSKAGHCRMEIWLDAHGHEPEPFPEQARRTVEIGVAVETLMFNGLTFVEDDGTKRTIGRWWDSLGVLKDPISGNKLDPSDWILSDYQREVDVDGWKGHIDAIGHWKTPLVNRAVLIDCKTTQGYGYERVLKGQDLLKDPFMREYVYQMNFYMEGLRRAGVPVEEAILLFFNKEKSNCVYRTIAYSPDLVTEALERLSWANSGAEPVPDWDWPDKAVLPLRCRYCSQRVNCAGMRGMVLTEFHNREGTLMVKAERGI